jgi:hypothetical protein
MKGFIVGYKSSGVSGVGGGWLVSSASGRVPDGSFHEFCIACAGGYAQGEYDIGIVPWKCDEDGVNRRPVV